MKNFDEKFHLMFNFLKNDTQSCNYAVNLTVETTTALFIHSDLNELLISILHIPCWMSLFDAQPSSIKAILCMKGPGSMQALACLYTALSWMYSHTWWQCRPRKDLFTFKTCTVVKEPLFSNELQVYENTLSVFLDFYS